MNFLSLDQTVNQHFYNEALKHLQEYVWRKLLQHWASGEWYLLHDNARPHIALCIQNYLAQHKVTVLPHLAMNVFLFARLQMSLIGQRFQRLEDLKEESQNMLRVIIREELYCCFQRFKDAGICGLMPKGTNLKVTMKSKI